MNTTSKHYFFWGGMRIVTDFCSAFLAWNLAYMIRPFTDLIPYVQQYFPPENLPTLEFFIPFVLICSLGFIVILGSVGLYSFPPKMISMNAIGKIIWGIILWLLCITAFYALFRHELLFSRVMLLHAGIFTFLFATLLRGFLQWIYNMYKPEKRILLIGAIEDFEMFSSVINQQKKVAVFAQVLFDTDMKLLQYHPVDEVVFFEGEGRDNQLNIIKEIAAEKGWLLRIVPSYAKSFFGHAIFDSSWGMPMLLLSPLRFSPWWFAFKRSFDITFSLGVLTIGSPIFLLLSICIKLDSSGEVFYRSERIGRNGKKFFIWKFRTMIQNADQQKKELVEKSHRDGPLFKIKNDPRITRVGRWLRRTSMDEIPQFWNVLKGDMSVIGPRPHLYDEISQYTSAQRRVLAAKPGITGMAQVSGRSDLSFEEEIFYDSYYVQNTSAFLDIYIFFKTFLVLLSSKGAD